MAIFLRGNVWWMEYRTRKVRKVLSTGFRREERAKAQAAFDAFRLGMGARPKRSAMEAVLDAIYGDVPQTGVALTSLWGIFGQWADGKGKSLSRMTETNMRGIADRLAAWAAQRQIATADEVTVAVARDFVAHLRKAGLSNKSMRTYVQYLGSMWKAAGQMIGRLDNPWPAACPVNDGSSVSRGAFSAAQEASVLAAAKKVGHGWWLASMIARWTGLRYGDVARLDWCDIDMERRTISATPSKTRKHGVTVLLPIAGPLHDALSQTPVDKREGWVLPEQALHYGRRAEVAFAAVLREAGVGAPFTFHSWRHTFRTRLAEAGVADEVARRMGGWTNLKMAAHYDHATHLDEMRAAMSAMTGG